MPTVHEVLKATGFTDEQIAALDPKAITAFSGIMTDSERRQQEATAAAAKAEQDRATAQATLDKAELERRSLNEFYETKVVTGLTDWQAREQQLLSEGANDKAMAAFYKAQNEAARTAGFVPAEAPKFAVTEPPAGTTRNAAGQYVANAPGSTPGSPTFVNPTEIAAKIGDVAGTLADIQYKYAVLNGGKPMPISPSELIRQADSIKLSPMEYASRTFKFAEREAEIQQQAAQAHDKQVADTAVAAKQAEHDAEVKKMRDEFAAKERARAEGGGNNPDVRTPPGSSKFAEVARAVKAGDLPDPLKMTDAQRRAATRQVIHKEIEENAQAVA